jgi:hypothetical protein
MGVEWYQNGSRMVPEWEEIYDMLSLPQISRQKNKIVNW